MKRIKIFPYEHCDIKDVRVIFDTFRKQNINFMEILFTDWGWINPLYKEEIEFLRNHREEIAHLNYNQALRCMVGMSLEKIHALEHPYPTCAEEIEKYGYSRKQLSHIVRINDFITKYVAGVPYKQCLIPDNIDYIIKLKTKPLPLPEARKIAEAYDAETYRIKEDNLLLQDRINEMALHYLDMVKCKIIKKKFKKELLEEEYDA